MLPVRSLIVGGGPAGLAPLVAASRDGRLDRLLREGIAVIERGPAIGAGRLGSYAITSDSTAETFLTAVTGHADPRLGRLLADPLCQEIARRGRGPVPLPQAARLLDAVGAVLADAVAASGGAVLTRHDVIEARRTRDGTWRVLVRREADGATHQVECEKLLLATGGVQDMAKLAEVEVAGRPLLPSCAGRLMLSDTVLRPDGLAAVRERLSAVRAPRVVIVGGSTSALAAAGLLLRECGDLLAAPGSITILHRRPLRVFYPSAAAAEADGYADFGPDDICPLSGFVYRLAGFRLDSRDLVMRLLGIGGRPPEPRIVLRRLDAQARTTAAACLDAADLVVAATGYRPRALPLRDAAGQAIALRNTGDGGPLVDRSCRICGADGRPIPNLFGIGLAAGFVLHGALGGEPSFRGQANGLWLWQTAVGTMIVDHLLPTEIEATGAPRARPADPIRAPDRSWDAVPAFGTG